MPKSSGVHLASIFTNRTQHKKYPPLLRSPDVVFGSLSGWAENFLALRIFIKLFSHLKRTLEFNVKVDKYPSLALLIIYSFLCKDPGVLSTGRACPAFCLQTHGEVMDIVLADLFNESPEFTQHSSDCRVGKKPFGKIIEW